MLFRERTIQADIHVIDEREGLRVEPLQIRERYPCRGEPNDDIGIVERPDDVRQECVLRVRTIRENWLVPTQVHCLDVDRDELSDDTVDVLFREVASFVPDDMRITVLASVWAVISERPADVFDVCVHFGSPFQSRNGFGTPSYASP